MGSSSLANSSSTQGLKFGHKTHSEDVVVDMGAGSPAKSMKKGRGGSVQGAQPPRCQVEGCKVDLSDAKAYYSRHKVCAMHSKSPRVVVAGIQQRDIMFKKLYILFTWLVGTQIVCDYVCTFAYTFGEFGSNLELKNPSSNEKRALSRFHQLSEFDQEKRSCRRRLAGHNERRRKPQPSSLLSSPYGRLSSPVFDKSGRVGGFLMEFGAYRKLTQRNALSNSRSSEQVAGNQTTSLPWQNNMETSSDIFLRGSVGGISYLGPRSPPRESFTGITDTSCALSLLSNQTWGPGHGAPSLGLNNLYYEGTPMTQLTASSPDAAIHQISNASWCFKGTEAGNCSHEVVPDLGLGQVSQPLANQLPDEASDHRRQYMDLLEQSRVYESSQLMHWPIPARDRLISSPTGSALPEPSLPRAEPGFSSFLPAKSFQLLLGRVFNGGFLVGDLHDRKDSQRSSKILLPIGKMVCMYHYEHLIIIVFSAILTSRGLAYTDPADVAALRDLYKTLNYPVVLKRWNVGVGDPCKESWTGVACSGSSVIHLKIQGLNLTGHLGGQLHKLQNLKQLSNKIVGEIPFGLPPNATHINMAWNYLSQNIPHSLPSMKKLRHLNVSHNFLSGPIGNVFTGLDNLKEMDLSYNNFTGDLPSSFGSLKNLARLFLQHNDFTGSVAYLAELPLTDLNIQENMFSGIIPQHFQFIPNLWIGRNKFHAQDNSPPWDFPFDSVPVVHNISRPPTTQANAIENYSPRKVSGHKKSRMGPGEIAFMVGGGTLLATGVALFIAIRLNRLNAQRLKNMESSHSSLQSPPTTGTIEISPTALEESPRIPPFNSASILGPRRLPPLHRNRIDDTSRRSFTKRSRFSGKTKVYTVAELQLATNSFGEDNFLGEGSLGPVYRAVFPEGQTMAVKNINMVGLTFREEEKFLDVVSTASRLRHPNIVAFSGYCLEHGQHLLVYDYVRNLTLDDALHNDAYKPLSWPLRLRIALGVAHALDYLHSTFSPPVTHGNLKAANILLDEHLMPRVCDCGLAILRPLINNKVKGSEIASGDAGYISPDHGLLPGIGNTKSDVYAFGVLLLELLTGRKPLDDSRPREEQYLVKWALPRLHDSDSLEQMVDPGIQKTISSKALSRYADIVSLCIQPVKEFRSPMSEVVDTLTSFSQNFSMSSPADVSDFDKSFRSTNTRFLGSPALSYVSA
ncbi:protein STRUBBELIG-RECEPTOR FAMILY 2 [Senna tora]|uniref:Protein STRUBBELIG-RECEPTOR FAMILY 2 n=1 Tax=Senna tora TaxID=362788 RepID=A0A834TBJ5_9FABA|nr:protein STRUBBELIG-RECEPTOR FAMILY 2 [Senna tora]